MTPPPGLLPPEIQALTDEFEQHGFSIVNERYEGEHHFGDSLVDYEHDGLAIRVVRDRGEWAFAVAGPGRTKWFWLMTWWAFLDHVMPPDSPMKLHDEIEFVRERLPRLQEVMRDPGPEVLEGLLDWQYRIAKRWLR